MISVSPSRKIWLPRQTWRFVLSKYFQGEHLANIPFLQIAKKAKSAKYALIQQIW